MTPVEPQPPLDAREEISALIETLHSTGQRLEELTAGEVDGVADRDGRTFLLRHVQEQLRHNEAARQTSILNALPAHIALLDSQGRIVSVNQAWQRFADANALRCAEYGIGTNYLDVCDSAQGDDAATAQQAAAGIRALRNGAANHFSMEYPCHSPTRQRWFLLTASVLTDEHPTGVVVMHLDITERRQAETALHESEAALRAIFDGALDGILVVDAATRKILTANAAICSMLGYTSEEILRIGVSEIHPEQALPLVAAHFERFMRGDTQMAAGIPMRHRDGSVFYADIKASPLRLDGKACALGIFRDITERKQVEQEWRESERRFSDLLGNIELVAMMLDREARITYCNEYLLRLTGWQREEIVGRGWFEVFIPPEIGDMKSSFFAALLSNLPDTRHRENEILTRSGERRQIRWSNSVLRSGGGEVIGTASIGEDITEQKRAERALAKLQRQSELILESLEEGVYGLDPAGIVTFQNPAAAKLLGYRSDELIGRRAHATMHYARSDGTPFPVAECPIHITLADGVVRRVEDEVFWRKDGASVPVEYTTAPIRDGQGAIVGVVVAFRDVSQRQQREQEILAAKNQMQATLDASPDLLFEMGLDGRYYTYHSPRVDLLAAPPEALLGKTVAEALPAEAAETIMAALREADATGRSTGRQFELALPQGRLWFELSISRMAVAAGKEARFICLSRDITERRESANRIVRLNRIYAVLSSINSLIVRTRDRNELFTEACRIAVEQGGFKMAWIGSIDADGLTVTPVAKAGVEAGYLDNMQLSAIQQDAPDGGQMVPRALQEGVGVICNDIATEPQMAHWRDEALRRGYRSVAMFPLRVSEKVVGLFVLYAAEADVFDKEETDLLTELAGDISFALDYIEKEKKLNYLAYYDVLTGLPNRSLLHDRLTQGVSLARRNGWQLAVMFVDLDNFKTVNDTLGHTIGDALLAEVSRRLASCLRDTDTVGRLGGDEFAIILPEIGNSEAVAMVARKVIESCRQPYLIERHELFVSASLGIALFPDDAGDGDTLIRNADIAMYRAKDLGRNTYQFFTAELNDRVQDKLRLETDLRHALGNGEFLLHYQPKTSCASGKVTGFEALLRWQNPQRGLVGPDEFIPALEDSGLIVPVGEWVLASACAQAKRWEDAGLGTLSMAVNISGRQINAVDLCETVRAALAASGLPPAHLELELTESQLMKDAEGIVDLLQQLKAMGVNLAIDDFGTGYSSLAYLKRFPIDTLKIDKAFVRDIITDTNDISITRAIISLAHNLKLKVVAEGVETEGQLGLLIANHCDEMQGYYFSRPLPAEAATALLQSGRTLDSRMLAGMRRNRTLLLVDDEASILSSLKRLLRREGYEILTASSAAQGLEMLAIHPVDVIVSDQRMPGMSGVEFLRRVKTLHPETVRLVLSGYTDLKAVTDAINEGAIYKFLTKPWDDGILRANIEEAFRSKEMADENRRMHTELTLASEQMAAVNAQLQKLLASQEQVGDARQG